MELKSEPRKIAKYETIQLRDSKDGRIIAKLQEELDKYNGCYIDYIFLSLYLNKNKNVAIPIIESYINHSDVEEIRKIFNNNNNNKGE